MALKTYEIKNYGTRVSPMWSIDEYYGGEFLNQVAYWFATRAEAEKRLAEIIDEDNAALDRHVNRTNAARHFGHDLAREMTRRRE